MEQILNLSCLPIPPSIYYFTTSQEIGIAPIVPDYEPGMLTNLHHSTFFYALLYNKINAIINANNAIASVNAKPNKVYENKSVFK